MNQRFWRTLRFVRPHQLLDIAILVVALFAVALYGASGASQAVQPEVLANKPQKGLVYNKLRKPGFKSVCKKNFEVLDRVGTIIGCTHGPDPMPEGVSVDHQPTPQPQLSAELTPGTTSGPSTVAAAAPLCSGDGISGRRFEIIYAHAADKPDRYAQYISSFQQYVAQADDILRQSGLESGQARHFRFVTQLVNGQCQVVIPNVQLSAAGDDDFSSTKYELASLGYNNPDYKYVVLTDANIYCGLGELWGDDYPTPDNFSNRNFGGAMYARVDTGCWDSGTTIAHEMIHTLGGVQESAPHGTPYGHCTDEYDIMCYVDGPGVTMQYVCPLSENLRLDCNKDDYFNTSPPAGSYLANYWNTANNSFLIKGDVVNNTLPTVALTSLSDGSYIKGFITNVSNTVTSPSEIMTMQLYVDGVLVMQDPLYPFTELSWDTTQLADGLHTVQVVAINVDGNQGASATISVTVDNTPPSKPQNLQTRSVTPSQVSLVWNASNDSGGLADYRVRRDSVQVGVSSTNSFSDPTVSAMRGYTYQVVAWDRAGNSTASDTLYVAIPGNSDTEAPTVAITSPGSNDWVWPSVAGKTIDVTAVAADNRAVASVALYVDGSLASNMVSTSGGYSGGWFAPSVTPGTYTLTARAYDFNGNSQLSDPVTVVVALPMQRLYNDASGIYFYSGSGAETDIAAQGAYHYEGISFYGSPVAGTGLTPLYRLYNPKQDVHFYTTSAADRDFAAAQAGYYFEGISMYVATGRAGGTYVPVYRLYDPRTAQHIYTVSTTERDVLISLGYTSEGIVFYAKEAPPSAIAPVYRLYNPSNGDHFYTTSVSERNSILAGGGYIFEGVKFYARTASAYGYSPVYRLFNPRTGDHFYTKDSAERDSVIGQSGYVYEGITFYSGGAVGEGPVGVFRLFSTRTGDHFYTTDLYEMLKAQAAGYKSEGTALFVQG